jgi:hypothetical protein
MLRMLYFDYPGHFLRRFGRDSGATKANHGATSGSTCPAAMPDASRSVLWSTFRRRQARTRQLGLQCCCVARPGVNGWSQPLQNTRVLTPGNAWRGRSDHGLVIGLYHP